ncbi:MAG: alpha/beta hydrolase, partial [Salinivirgaceae bacterium]|nr:alpha/beta hydrolase [Salinivirgaceae bacterium]
MKNLVLTDACIAVLTGCSQQKTDKTMNTQELQLTQEWDKVFAQSDKVNHSKITFHNRYGITLAADLYVPKNA